MKTRIPIKKFQFQPLMSFEWNYQQLETHHGEETQFLIGRIEELEKQIDDLKKGGTDADCLAPGAGVRVP